MIGKGFRLLPFIFANYNFTLTCLSLFLMTRTLFQKQLALTLAKFHFYVDYAAWLLVRKQYSRLNMLIVVQTHFYIFLNVDIYLQTEPAVSLFP